MVVDLSFEVPGDTGNALRVAAWRIEGSAPGPRVHLQAGVHADEVPGMLVLHKLMPRVEAAARAGRLRGSVTFVPQANPFGLAQFRQGRILGRFHEATHQNFNRGFTASTQTNPNTTVARWQRRLLDLATGADIVLDLHTDDEALPYLYVHSALWPAGELLAAALGSDVAILWDGDGGGAFEDAVAAAWLDAGAVDGRLVSTVELRGQADVDDGTAERDADGLYRFLCLRGAIDEAVSISAWSGSTVAIDRMETLFAPKPGVLVFERDLGDRVAAGETIARIVVRPGDPSSELIVRAPQDGLLLTRYRDRLVPQGAIVAKLKAEGRSTTWTGGVLDP